MVTSEIRRLSWNSPSSFEMNHKCFQTQSTTCQRCTFTKRPLEDVRLCSMNAAEVHTPSSGHGNNNRETTEPETCNNCVCPSMCPPVCHRTANKLRLIRAAELSLHSDTLLLTLSYTTRGLLAWKQARPRQSVGVVGRENPIKESSPEAFSRQIKESYQAETSRLVVAGLRAFRAPL